MQRDKNMNYRELSEASREYKKIYVEGIDTVINNRAKELEKERKEYIKGVFENPQNHRRRRLYKGCFVQFLF